jgi:hypothetical protein
LSGRAACERGHGRQVALLGVACELEAGAEETALERVGDDLAHGLKVGKADRRLLGVVPEFEPVLLDEVGVASRLAHDSAGRFLLVVDAERRGGADEGGARGRVGEAAELVTRVVVAPRTG